MAETVQQYPIDKFRALPDPVKGWLASTQITYLISDLNRRLGFSEEEKMSIIPTMILRLAISTVSPENFIAQLVKLLDLSPSAAKALAQEIEEKMLRPIEVALRNEVGIDIKLIHVPESMMADQQRVAAPVAPQPQPLHVAEKLIPSPEIAHPNEYRAPIVPPSAPRPTPIQSPVYSPAPQIAASPSAPRNETRMMPPVKPPLPRVEPLSVRPPINSAPPMSTPLEAGRPSATVAPSERPLMGPRVEPLPRPFTPSVPPSPSAPYKPSAPSMPPAPQPAYVPKPTTMPSDTKKTAIPFKFEPSRVPKFPPTPPKF